MHSNLEILSRRRWSFKIFSIAVTYINLVRYDDTGVRLVERSLALGQPLIYVSMNYRWDSFHFLPISCVLNLSKESPVTLSVHSIRRVWYPFDSLAWGFLPGVEVKQAGLGNLGLHDREYIYVQPNIFSFFVGIEWFYIRTRSTSLGTEIYRSVWWGQNQGHTVRLFPPIFNEV